MNLVKYSNFPAVFDRFFNDDFFNNWSSRNFSQTNTTIPAVNIKANENSFAVEMAAPGLSKDDFKIELDQNTLTISCEKKTENNDEKDNYSRQEYSYQSFSRSFTLPESADGEKISAKYEDGILKVDIPKKEEALPKPARKIEIG